MAKILKEAFGDQQSAVSKGLFYFFWLTADG